MQNLSTKRQMVTANRKSWPRHDEYDNSIENP